MHSPIFGNRYLPIKVNNEQLLLNCFFEREKTLVYYMCCDFCRRGSRRVMLGAEKDKRGRSEGVVFFG